jgi:3-oxoacyl-[acyl-carrier protein] reductase
MNISLEDKTYLIAGGSKGIGLALTHQLLAADANVHVYSRTEGDLPQSDRLVHHICDFSEDDFESEKLPEMVHGVAYCPGTINLRSFRSLKLADFRNDFEINVLGAIKFLKGCMAGLKKGADEHPTSVLLFSTVAAGTGLPMHASIAAAKGAIEGLTRTLAAEWAPKTRVNCLAPALTDTPLAANFFSTEEKRAAMDAKYPLGRSGTPTDQANMATLLLSPESGWITGQVIGVDGGMSTIHG